MIKSTLIWGILCNVHFLSAIVDPKEVVKKYTNGNKISIYENSKEMENLGFDNCDFSNNGESLIARTFIRCNDIVFDVGAHVGGWTRTVLDATKFQCTVYAFEPAPDSYKILKDLKNQFYSKVFCFNVALGKEEDDLELSYFDKDSGCSTLFNRTALQNWPVKKIKVPVISLDKFCKDQNITHINFLKIDTEGAELDIMIGAKNFITHNDIDLIQFEYGGTYPDARITLFQVYCYLQSNKYLIFRILPDGLIYIPEWNYKLENFRYSNYLAIKSHEFKSIFIGNK